jgi:UDP-GlcNAc3NAcA epimerase
VKVFTVVGARPQFIKAATVSRLLRQVAGAAEVLVHTGQHFDGNMSDVFFEQMSIPKPDFQLGVSGGGHGQMTGRMLEALESLMESQQPDWVLVYGDTNSTLAGALVAAKLHLPIAHVEAGLRSFNMKMPEEINRVLTDRLSAVLFCPTDQAVRNLEQEGYAAMPIEVLKVGDVMQDAALYYGKRAVAPTALPSGITDSKFAVATVHRAENTDDRERLANIMAALDALHERMPVVLPLHPRTRQRLADAGIKCKAHLIDPVGYLEMVWLLEHCRLVVTDSGGLQKEAWFFRKPCVTLRDETEWVELTAAGANQLVGTDPRDIANGIERALAATPDYDIDLYGSGRAAQRIVQRLLQPPASP